MKHHDHLAKIIALLLTMVMLLTACGGNGNDSGNNGGGNDSGSSDNGGSGNNGGNEDTGGAGGQTDDLYGGNIIYATGQVSTTLDPHKAAGATGNYQWMMHVYDTPLSIDTTGNIYDNACLYELSEDGLTLTLTVREGEQFSDGTPMTIEDVVASLDRLCENVQVYKTCFVDTVSDRTVEGDSVTYHFTTFDVMRLWRLTDAAQCMIMKKEIIDKLGPDGTLDSIEDSIGSNCYVLTKYEPDIEVVISRNDKYLPVEYDCDGLAGTRHAYADTITFATNTDTASRTAGMLAGDYSIGSVSADMEPQALEAGIRSWEQWNLWIDAFFFNLSEEFNGDSIVQNKDFRKAVRAVMDMDEIMLSIQDGREDAYYLSGTPISKENTPYQDGILEKTDWNVHDMDLAKEYLEKSGYAGEPVVLLTPSSGSFYKLAVPFAAELEELGINVELKTVDSGSHGSLRNDPSSGYDIGMWETQAAAFVPTTNSNHVVGTTGGAQCWQNAQRDELVEKILSSQAGSAESTQAWKDLAALFAEEVPWVICGQKISHTYSQKDVVLDYAGTIAYFWNSYFED